MPCPLKRSPKPGSKMSSPPHRRSVISTAIAACSRTTATTSTIWRAGASFEEVCYLLWHGRLPNRAELGDLQSQLAAARPLREPILRLMKQLPASDGMDTLRTLTSALGHYDPDAADNSPQAQLPQGGPADGAARQPRRDLRPDAGGRRADPAGSGARPRGELPLHADRQPARTRCRRARSTSRWCCTPTTS